MNRRDFLQSMAATTAGLAAASGQAAETYADTAAQPGLLSPATPLAQLDTSGHTKLCTFDRDGQSWAVYEDLRTRDGAITFVGPSGGRVLRKTAEASFAEGTPYLGLTLKDIGMTSRDLLAEKLLAGGSDPVEEQVRTAAPPMNSAHETGPFNRPRWETIVGTRQCADTMPVYPSGNTRTYHPSQYFHELTNERANHRYEGLVGGWTPAVRKVFPDGDAAYYEVVVFGDVKAQDRFIVQTWHRTTHVQNGAVTKVEYGYSYPAYTRRRQPPAPEEFYRGLLAFAEQWDTLLHDMAELTLPTQSWVDMARYAFVKEQIVRPDGTYPKYGAVDRDYYGSEYDGFQDIFTMSLTANLELGRFQLAHDVFDGYFSDFTDEKGIVNMRGPETAQFGLTLWLIRRYYSYTRDGALIRKHRAKIEATAALLAELQDESLTLDKSDRGYGLIWGWNESDSCLNADPSIWNKPYFANAAMTVRGWRELAKLWRTLGWDDAKSADWERRADRLQTRLLASIESNTRHSMQPPYIGPLPGTTTTFLEAIQKERPTEQGWPHRAYAELLHADVLPEQQANLVIDCMRAYGATTLGVVANVEPPNPDGRSILGFISYGYAQQLLQRDRIEEYILFLYAHRYHDHSRGSWTAGEVSGIAGGSALFCIPAQQTIPILLKWMLVYEEPDREVLHLGRAIPRAWIGMGKPIGITGAPTRWGRVDYRIAQAGNQLTATVTLHSSATEDAPRELHVRFRVPAGKTLGALQVNGKPVAASGRQQDTAAITPGKRRTFVVTAQLA